MRRLIRAFASLAAIAAIAALPIALGAIATVRFGSPQPWTGIQLPQRWAPAVLIETVSQPLSDVILVDLMIRSALVIGWAVIVLVVIEIVRECHHRLRYGDLPRRPQRAMALPRSIARFIAAGLIVTTGQFGVARAAVPISTILADRSGIDAELSDSTRIAPTSEAWASVRSSPVDPPILHTVRDGESLLDIAARYHRGEGEIEFAMAILRANRGASMSDGQTLSNPVVLEPGWTLSIPGTGVPIRALASAPGTQVRTHQVVSGDTLWDIAAQHLGEPRRWPEIWELNANREMGQGRIFDDPSLILPGWVLDLPLDPPAVEAPQEIAAEVAPVQAPEIPPAVPPTVSAEVTPAMSSGVWSDPSIVPTTLPVRAPAPSTSSVPTITTVLGDRSDSTGAAVADAADTLPQPPAAPRSGQLVAIGGSLLVGSALFAIEGVRRRRLRAASIRSRTVLPSQQCQRIERRIRALGDTERLVRLDLVIRAATAQLIDDEIPVLMVSMAPDGAAALTPSRRHPARPPWLDADGTWQLSAEVSDDDLLEMGIGTTSPTVTLVQIGIAPSGDEVYLDLEAAGLVVIRNAPAAEGRAVLASIVANLQLSPFAEVDDIVVFGELRGLDNGTRPVRHLSSIDDLEHHLEGIAAAQDGASPFTLRCRGRGGERWEPTIVVAPGPFDTHIAERLVAAARRSSVTVVASEIEVEPAVGLHHTDDGWVLEIPGHTPMALDLARIPPDVLSMLDLTLAETGSGIVEEPPLVPFDQFSEATPDDENPALGVVFVEPMIVVRLFGPVDVVDQYGASIGFDRARSVELLAWMVTHRHRSTRSAARTAMWEVDIRDATFANIVSDARRSLFRAVTLTDGSEWIERTLTDELPLHTGIVSDAELLERAFDDARIHGDTAENEKMIRRLEERLGAIRGLPFEGTSYLWPDAEGLSSALVLLVISAVGLVADHHLARNDVAGVFAATDIGLRVLPAHEELIALRLRAHLAVGDLAGARHEWDSYLRVLARDPWADVEPAPGLVALRNEIHRRLATPSRAGGHRDRPD